uniref:Uncharacterized protein n=1 Tax=Solanum lycopersicum TaxID=4081 RepID=K4CH82_SOLLC
MLGEGEAVPGNGGISSSNPDPPSPPKADSNSNLETELLCDESFSEIIEKEVVVVEEEVVSSDSLNERKRLRTDEEEDHATEDVSDSSKSRRIREEEAVSSDSLNERKRLHTDEEEDDATEAVSDSSKLRRIHEEEGQKEIDEQKGNQDSEEGENQESEVADEKDEENDKKEEESEQNEGKEDGENEDKDEEEKETEGGNQENNNGEEEDQNEEDETEEVEKDDELPQFSTAEEAGEKHNLREYRENVGGEDNVNRINSEQNEGNEDRDNGKKEEEEKETEEQKQKAVDKGKRPLFEESEEDEDEEEKQQAAKKWQKTSLVPITPNFSKFLQGESSRRTKTDQIQISTPKVDTELVDIQINYESPKDHDYHRDLNILIAMYDFKLNNGHLPYPHADELHNHIMDLMPDLNILGDDLTVKITAFEDDFNTALILDGDNPEMAQPIEREIFNLSKQLWGYSDDNVGDDQTLSERIAMFDMKSSRDHHPPHFNNDLQNEESTISADETEDQKSRGEGELQESELKYMLSKVEEKGKRPMSESYELKSINKPTFSNLERGGTSENESMKEDEYDYDHDIAILKSIYHYFFNHGVIPYPYSENFINYIEASISNLKFHGLELLTKILALEHQFFSMIEITAGRYPVIMHPVFREIFYLSMGLWGYPQYHYPVDNVDVITRNKERENEEKLQAVKKGKRPMSELYEFQYIVPTFSNPGIGAGTSENIQEEDYDFDQDLAILKSMYHYCFNHGGKLPRTSRELINYIEALVPKLKVRGQELQTKIVTLKNNVLAIMTIAGEFDPDKIHPVYREIFYLSMGLWG